MKLICIWRFNYREKWGEIDTGIDYSVGMTLAAEIHSKVWQHFQENISAPLILWTICSWNQIFHCLHLFCFCMLCDAHAAIDSSHRLRKFKCNAFDQENVQGRINRLVHCRLALLAWSWHFMASKKKVSKRLLTGMIKIALPLKSLHCSSEYCTQQLWSSQIEIAPN